MPESFSRGLERCVRIFLLVAALVAAAQLAGVAQAKLWNLFTTIAALLAVGLFKPRQLDARLVMLIPDPRGAHHCPVAAKIRMRAGVIAVNILPGGVDQRVRQHDLR